MLKIGGAAKYLGISRDTLRRWEKSGKISSTRTPSGYRVYNLDQLKALKKILAPQEFAESVKSGPVKVPSEPAGSRAIKWLPKAALLTTVLMLTISGVLAAGYLKLPKQTLQLTQAKPFLATSTSEESKPTPEVSGSVLGLASDSINLLQNITSILLSPFNFIAQKLVQTTAPDYARQIGIYQQTTDEKIETLQQSLKQELNNLQTITDSRLDQTQQDIASVSEDLTQYQDQISQNIETGRVNAYDAFIGARGGDGVIGQSVIDSYGNIYPRRIAVAPGDKPSLGTPNNRWFGIYANRFTLDTGGNLKVFGQTTLGDAPVDYIKFIGRIATDIIPSNNGEISLGAGDKYFKNLYVNNVTADTGGFSSLSVTNFTVAGSAGTILLSDGSASSPSLAFTNDTDTGLYRIGANKIGLITGGSPHSGITIDGSGNVGIGTSGPTTTLHVVGTAIITGATTLSSTLNVSGNTGLGTATIPSSTLGVSGNVAIGADYTSSSTPTNGLAIEGRVGIGTTSPLVPLHINGSIRMDGIDSSIRIAGGDGGTGGGEISFASQADGLGSTGGFSIRAYGSAGTRALTIGRSNNQIILFSVLYNGNIGIGTTSPSQIFQVNTGSSATVITSTGNVGIGTTSPASALHIIGTTSTRGNILTDVNNAYDIGSAAMTFKTIYANEVNASTLVGTVSGGNISAETLTINSDNATNDAEDANLRFHRGTASPHALLTWDSTNKEFDFNSQLHLTGTITSANGIILDGFANDIASPANEHISIIPGGTGNVGIATTAPGAKLSVNGNAIIGYSGTSAAPTNGLAVQGNVGIGTTSAGTWGSPNTQTAALTVQGAFYANNPLGEHTFINSKITNDGSGNPTNSNVLRLLHHSPTGSDAVRFIEYTDTYEQGGMGYQNGTGSFYLDDAVFLSAGRYDSSGTAKTGNPPKIILGQEGYYSGTHYNTARLTFDNDWSFKFQDAKGNAYLTGPAVADANGGMQLRWVNFNNGTAASADIQAVSASGNVTAISAYPAAYTYHAYPPSGGALNSDGTGGLGIFAANAAGVINFYTGGDQAANFAMTITSGGNVGIGNSVPGAKLSVSSNAVIGYGNSISAPSSGLAVSGNVGIGITTANSTLSVAGNAHIGSLYQGISAPTNGLFVDGNVGIGATTSSNKLDVWGNARITGNLTVDGSSTVNGTVTPSGQFLAIDGTAAAPGYAFAADTDTGLWRIGTNFLALTTAGSAQTAGTTINGLSVNTSGNVGIGTTNSGSTLTVNGDIKTGDGTAAAPGLRFTSEASGFYRKSSTEIGLAIGGSLRLGFGDNNDGHLNFYGNNALINSDGISGSLTFWEVGTNNTFRMHAGTVDLRADTFTFERGNASTTTLSINAVTQLSNFYGNVGIGTTAVAGAALQVNGGGIFWPSTTTIAGPTNGLAVFGNVGIGTTSPLAPLHVQGNGTNSAFFLNGNVGIGTTTPGASLQINTQSATTKGLIIQGNRSPTQTQPNNISGLILWLKADAITGLNDGDAVTTWSDQSGSGNNATQATAGNKPLYKTNIINGQPVVRFDSTNDFLASAGVTTANLPTTADHSMIVIYRPISLGGAGSSTLIYLGNYNVYSPNFDWIGLSKTDATDKVAYGDFASAGADGTINQDNAVVSGSVYEMTGIRSSNRQYMFVNGTQQSSTPTSGNPNINSAATLHIGIVQDEISDPLGGDIAEIIIYNRALTAADRKAIDTYLGSKYNISLPGTPYQTANLTEWQDSTGSILSVIDASGNVGIGYSTAPIALAVNGNVGIGITTANSTLSVAGNAHIGSLYQGISAPANGLFVDGNVGIGATTSSNKLDVWGNARITGTLTVDNNLTSSGGQFLANNGTASLPSYSFTNLTNAGLWTNGNGLLLTTGGSNTSGITVTGAGNVGIGITSPSQLFQVNANASNPVVITSGGNVGIGITTPTTKLEVSGDSLVVSGTFTANNYNAALAVISNFTTTSGIARNFWVGGTINPPVNTVGYGELNAVTLTEAASGTHSLLAAMRISIPTITAGSAAVTNTASLYIEGAPSATVTGANYSIWADAGTARFDGTTLLAVDSGNVGIGFTSPNFLFQVNSGTSTTFINSSGNVGIGATTSSNKLDVWGNARITGTLTVDGALTSSSSITPSGQFLAIDGTAAAPGYAFANDTDTGIFRPSTNALGFSTGGSSRMTITAAGNVGIGTTSPDMALTVAGDVNIRSGNGMVIGHTAQITSGDHGGVTATVNEFQMLGVSRAATTMLLGSFSTAGAYANAPGPGLTLFKSKSGTVGTAGAVVSGDFLGEILWKGDNGTDFLSNAASIYAEVDGEVGTAGDLSDMPGRLVFATTADGAEQPGERMRITSGGNVGIGASIPIAKFQVNSSVSNPFVVQSGGNVGIGVTTVNSALVINQGAVDTTILQLKSSDITQNETGFHETDTFASFRKYDANAGGLETIAVTESGNTIPGFYTYAVGDGDTTKTSTSIGAHMLWAAGHGSGGGGQFQEGGNLLVIGNNSANHFIFDENANLYLLPDSGMSTLISGSTTSYLMGGNVGIGDTSPDSPLEVLSTSTQLRLSYADGTDATFGVDANGGLTITPLTTNSAGTHLTLALGTQSATNQNNMTVNATKTNTSGNPSTIYWSTTAAPTSASTATYYGPIYADTFGTTTNLSGATIIGSVWNTGYNVSSDSLGTAIGLSSTIYSSTAGGTVTNGYGIQVTDGAGSGAITSLYGIQVAAQTKATNNVGIVIGEATGTKQTNLLIGTTTIPTGSWSIYNSSADANYFAGNVGIGFTSPNAQLTVGTANQFQVTSTGGVTAPQMALTGANQLVLGQTGGQLGTIFWKGSTSGTLQMQPTATITDWTWVLPPNKGTAGQQLQTDGNGVTTWEAAGSMREYKNLLGFLNPQDALARIVQTPIHTFTYKDGYPGVGGDYKTLFTGIVADEAPWAMMHEGTIFNPINAFGHSAAAIQALDQLVNNLSQADFISADATIETGDLVSFPEASSSAQVVKSEKTYAGRLAGVISNPPTVAMAGRVPVKVSTENGAIQIGDFLTSSSIPGVAMKATRPGQVIGKALESLVEDCNPEEGAYCQKKILAFVNVSFADPGNFFANLSLDQDGNLLIPKIKVGSLILDPSLATASASLTADSSISSLNTGVEVTQTYNLADKLASIEEKQAELVNSVQVTGDSIASQSAELAETKSQLADLAAKVATSSANSSNCNLQPETCNLNLTPPDTLYASGSATLTNLEVSEATVSGMLTAYKAEIQENFKVFGQTSLGKTNIAGDLFVDGTLSIENGSEINVISTLYLQKSLLSSSVDIFNGKVTIDSSGDIRTQGKITAQEIETTKLTIANPPIASDSAALGANSNIYASIGTATLTANTDKVTIVTQEAKDNAKVFITPTTPTDKVLSITNIKDGLSFDVSTISPSSTDINFNWWIVQTK